jgi:Helicase HerA, central domain
MELDKGDLYLGRDADDQPVVYPADNLTTHGVIVGMTGSGKTGLGIDMIEEALLNGISCLVIDPKGDMGNLALNFPDFEPQDFLPWVDAATAAKEGKGVEQLAEETASLWKTGLEGHGIDSERMRRLADHTEVTIYTPGSGAGVGLDVLGSLQAPKLDWSTESEVIRDEISAFVSSLLVLAGIESDPVSGQEHILLATLVEHFWRDGRSLDLATLVAQVPRPPFRKMGVFDIDTFFPEKDRMALALRLNGLLASPTFASWMDGIPLDIETLIGGEGTKAAIVYLAHLSDEERQFLVTLLLGKAVTWIRSRPGTSELRAMIYMDEVFGFAPPTKEPPSKTPILTILKQARAHGVGMVLSTQNPVDLDYKAMSNAGTWMVGRLQTENDKRRILEGLASATGDVDIDSIDEQISGLGKRQFLLHSTKSPEPTLFTTRWAMSYLAGPLTREQVTTLMADRRSIAHDDEGARRPEAPSSGDPESQDTTVSSAVPPAVASGVPVTFLDPAAPWAGRLEVDPTATSYRPAAAATVQLLYDDTKAGVNHSETWEAIIYPLDGVVDVADVLSVDHDERDFLEDAPPVATFAETDARLDTKTFWKGVESDLAGYLVANRPLRVPVNTDLGLYGRVDESESDFEKRCAAAAEDAADAELAKIKDRMQDRIDRVRQQVATAQTRFQEADAVAAAKSQETMLGTAGDLLGAFLGGKSGTTALNKAASRRTASAKAGARADSAEAKYQAKVAELEELEAELAEIVTEVEAKYRALAANVGTIDIPLEKTDVRIAQLKLVWVPVA